MSIYFDGSQCGVQIQPLPYQSYYTIEGIYQYLQQENINASQYYLTVDGSPLHPQDNTLIGQIMQPNSAFTIMQYQQIEVSIFFDQQQISQLTLKNIIIIDILTYLRQQGNIFPQNIAIDFYDGQQHLIAQDVDVNQQLYNYTNGNQVVMINIRLIQQDIQTVYDNNFQSNVCAQDLLQQLILLKNLSLLIDPNNQFVVYKYHFPTMVQGYLQKSQGYDPEQCTQFNWKGQDWVDKNSIKYCSFDDYGFAILWDDGRLSSVKIKQL
ncbi:unnamed protein product [Paramecium octaurelia]|uniref:Uncharacterized protein n=1 Tax=Paramecium octaurelia TaxID=43137 RepID=A0A8S1V4V4_PAROT|nr:unnamed protein product [Paramecium octaurelia]